MKIYYFNSTHWDREWYLPFQSFRYELVETFNHLVKTMEQHPEFRIFCLDGQTVVLEDYADIEPYNAKRLRALIEQGRVVVGPWYTMPDEYSVSGESLIRNLSFGMKLAEKWGGKPLMYGYINDIFGHIAQLPQILNGFGINGAYISRGLGDTDFNHFVWSSPNGSTVYTTVGDYSYFKLRVMSKFGMAEFKEKFREFMELSISRCKIPVVFISNTWDHSLANPEIVKVFRLIKEMYPEAEICDVTPDVMANELGKYADKIPHIGGELCMPMAGKNGIADNLDTLYHCISSYYPIKQYNDYCQNILEQRIEPMIAVSRIEGREFNRRYIEKAYEYLLKNHAHDSICGCSVSAVHKDMIYRFDQVRQICNCLYEEYLKGERDIQYSADVKNEYVIKIFNSLPRTAKKCYSADVRFYDDFNKSSGRYTETEKVNNFKIFDTQGKEIPYQILDVQKGVLTRSIKHAQYSYRQDVYKIAFEAETPAFGYAEYKLMPSDEKVGCADTLPYGENWAENGIIRLDIEKDGSLKIFDIKNSKVYERLNIFADDGEIGDGWKHQAPVNNETVYADSAKVVLIYAGAFEVKFRIEQTLSLPESFDFTVGSRSERRCEMRITSFVTVQKDSPTVKVEVALENCAKDHRLRVLFPTNVTGDKYFAGQAFYQVERKTGFDRATVSYREPDVPERNMNGIVGKRGADGCGIAFVSAEGLHEAACFDNRESTIAVTLFRAFQSVVMQNNDNGGQLQKKMKFRYALIPLDSNCTYSDLLDVRQDLSETDMIYSGRVENGDAANSPKSYFEIKNRNIALSIFKCSEDKSGYILRTFNTTGDVQSGKISFGFDVEKVYLTDLNENEISELSFLDNSVMLQWTPYEIKTVKITKFVKGE